MEPCFDAVVIGGGPAGSVAAMLLAEQGWRTVLLERGKRHRVKTCGHCLNPRVLPLLARIGVKPVLDHIAAGLTSNLHVHLQNGQALVASIHGSAGQGPGLLVERRRLDQALIDLAVARGVEVVMEATARVIEGGSEGAMVAIRHGEATRTVRARLVVGADGLRSAVARSAGLAIAGDAGGKYGFSFDLPANDRDGIQPGAIHMFVITGGYLGVIQQSNGVLHVAGLVGAGAMIAREPIAFCRDLAQRFAPLARAGFTAITHESVDHFTAAGPMPWRPERVAGAWAALVGDAAGYVEPFTGEGMSWAIESAWTLGDVTRELEAGAWTVDAARAYERRWRRAIAARHRACRALAWMLERSAWLSGLCRFGARHPRLTNRGIQRMVLT